MGAKKTARKKGATKKAAKKKTAKKKTAKKKTAKKKTAKKKTGKKPIDDGAPTAAGSTPQVQDSSPVAVFRDVHAAMARIASAMSKSPACEFTFEPLDPPGTAPAPVMPDVERADDGDLDEEDFDEDEEPTIPAALLAACRAVPGGASLRWSMTLKDGSKASGWLALPSEAFLLDNTTRTFMEGEHGFSIAPSSRLEVCWPADSAGDDVYVFDADGMLVAESRVADAFRKMVEGLGMPGWARGLTDERRALIRAVKAELALGEPTGAQFVADDLEPNGVKK